MAFGRQAGGVLGLGIEAGRQSWAAPHPAYQLAANGVTGTKA